MGQIVTIWNRHEFSGQQGGRGCEDGTETMGFLCAQVIRFGAGYTISYAPHTRNLYILFYYAFSPNGIYFDRDSEMGWKEPSLYFPLYTQINRYFKNYYAICLIYKIAKWELLVASQCCLLERNLKSNQTHCTCIQVVFD